MSTYKVSPIKKGGVLDTAFSKNKEAGLYLYHPQGMGLSNGVKVLVLCLVMIAIVGGSIFSQASAMTAEKVIENMIASHERRMKGVEDYTIVSEGPMGKITTYHKRAVIGGRVVYKTRTETEVMGAKDVTIYDGKYLWKKDPISGKVTKEAIDYGPFDMRSLKAGDAKYGGTEKVDGYKTHILNIKDMTRLIGLTEQERKEMKKTKAKMSGRIWVDAKDWIIRKMEIDTEVMDEMGKKETIKSTAKMEDFRRVNGLLIPYRTRAVMGEEMPKLSPEEERELRKELAEKKKGLEEIKKELEEMPPAERKMVEPMIKPTMEMIKREVEMIESMLIGDAVGLGFIAKVKSVTINTGLSDELFDGSKLK